MVKYDLPPCIDKILEVRPDAQKVTYIGYSQGTTLMFYGLAAMEEEFYGSKIKRAVMFAPCVFWSDYEFTY